MGFDIPNLHIDEKSPEGRVVSEIVAREGVTPEEVVRRGLSRLATEELSPADQMLGLFSSPEDSAMMDEIVAHAYEMRRTWKPRDLDL